jgi:tetratricopeptide (TPR) repeat protein
MISNYGAWVRIEDVVIPTYLPLAPDKNPMFLEKRVYQGSSGKVYPLPFTDRISEQKTDYRWKVIWLENELLRIMILPEIGGRIHAIVDKTNGYEIIYNQPVIKPALVGLAGPWISGGIEFNWPQHHRPATFMPVDFQIEESVDGSKTVWCSDHDPMVRMKGMHGICLHPGKAFVELKVRAYNRTPFAQTFLWWANAAMRVHEAYQSFFPPDVSHIADHARRAISEYPLCKGIYYGVNYGKRECNGVLQNEIPPKFVPPHCGGIAPTYYEPNDLSFYANIPTPCSYMCMGSQEDFFGGYDYIAESGIIHIANHHISPGKKQWTWGNHSFGYAWDRHLTDRDKNGEYRPYIELMAGVYTDNQPDFSFLHPGETKCWRQFWYPIQKIGPAVCANVHAAVSLKVMSCSVRLGVCVTERFPDARIKLVVKNKSLVNFTSTLEPGKPFIKEIDLQKRVRATDLRLHITGNSGAEIIFYKPKRHKTQEIPHPASEPPPPKQIASTDELFITGLHLEQYRHATRCPTEYWREALRRDPFDARCNNMIGRWHLHRGEFSQAEESFRRAIERLTRRNANPHDGEPYYNLGITRRFLGKETEAYAAFYKATWNQAWAAQGFHVLAEIDCRHHDWRTALEHVDHSLRYNTENLRALDLKALVLHRLNRPEDARKLLLETLALDPLDWWARAILGEDISCDAQTCLDLAHDFAAAGFYLEAIELLNKAPAPRRGLLDQSWGASPMVYYTLGWLHQKVGCTATGLDFYRRAASESPDYCFPSRLQEIEILESAIRAFPRDALAPYYLGNLFYDRRRHKEAIQLWEQSAKTNPNFSIAWRNHGIGYFNVAKKPAKARTAYDKAFQANPADARLLYERDQLWKRLGESPQKRLSELEKHPQLVRQRDDLNVELCALYNQTGQHAKALEIISSRKFQPWEGGEGQVINQHVRTHLAIGQEALANGDFSAARAHFERAFESPENLGEAKHLLANQSDVYYWHGVVLDLLGEKNAAKEQWSTAAAFKVDFQEMSVRTYSEMTYYSALALECLGQRTKARRLFHDLLAYARNLQRAKPKLDYFATSLPALLLFDDDLQFRQETTALFFQAQAQLGLGCKEKAKTLLAKVLRRDPNYALATELLKDSARTSAIKAIPQSLIPPPPTPQVDGDEKELRCPSDLVSAQHRSVSEDGHSVRASQL